MKENKTEDPLDNIVFNPDAERNLNDDIPTDPVKPKSSNKDKEEGENDPLSFIGYDPDRSESIEYDDVVEGIEVEDYRAYLGEDIFLPSNGDIGDLDRSRAINQSFFEQTRNMLGQAVVGEIIGGTVEGLGYLLEIASAGNYASGEEKEWGNILTDFGQSIRENSQEAMPIYQVNPGEMDFSDSGYWMSNGVSVASTLSMLIPSMAGSKILGLLGKFGSKGLGKLNRAWDVAENMTKKGKWLSEGISQAVLSRHIENSMEAAGTFRDIKESYSNKTNPETGELFTEEEAIKFASKAAADNYNSGWAMLLQDIPQYLALGRVFNPKTMKMEKALSAASDGGKSIKLKPWQAKTVDYVKTFASEGFEESYQFYISEKAKTLSDLKAGLIDKEEFNKRMSDAIGSDEMMTSAFFGGLGGNLFQAAGSGINALRDNKNKDRRENVEKYFEARAKQFAAMQIELSNTDKMDDPEVRESIIEQMMIQQTVEALDNNLFEEHMNTLRQMENMTEEQAKELEEKYGSKFDKNLSKLYIPEAIKSAEKIRKDYLRHLNKYDSDIAYKLASNDAMSRSSVRLAEVSRQKAEDLKVNMPYYDKLSDTQKKLQEHKAKLSALDFVIANYKEKVKNSTGNDKANFQSILDDRIKEREDVVLNDLKEINDNDNRTKREKYLDKRRLTAYENRLGDVAQEIVNEMQHEDNVLRYEKENELIKTEEYQKEFRRKKLDEKISKIDDEENIEKLITNVTEDKERTKEEKKEIVDSLEKKREEIKAKKQEKQKKEDDVRREDELKKKNAKAKEETNPTTPNNEIIPSEIDDIVVETHVDEEADLITDELDASEILAETKSFGNLKINPFASSTKEWKEFLTDSKKKVGKKVNIVLGNPLNKEAKQAVIDFNKGILNENVYDHLPLQAQLDGFPDASAYLNAKSKSNPNFKTNDFPARVGFIQALSKTGKAQTAIVYSFGGDLKMDPFTESGVAPENNPLDLKPIGGDVTKIDLVVSDKFGQLMDPEKKAHRSFIGRKIFVKGAVDEKGNKIAYKGGVFIVVPKADGTPFPLKLNLRKHTKEEAEVIADLMIEIIVNKKIKFNQRLSMIDSALADRIKEVFPQELNVLKKDPKIVDILDIVAYISDQTKGKRSELMMSGRIIKFGNKAGDGVVAAETLEKGRAGLIDFLMNEKRRQFNLAIWRESSKYRSYIFNSGVMSTNATVQESMFESTEERPIQVIISKIDTPDRKERTKPKASKSKLNLDQRAEKSQASLKKTSEGWTASYFDENGKETKYKGKTKEEVFKPVSELYDEEAVNMITNENPTETVEKKELDDIKKKRAAAEKSKKKKSPFEFSEEEKSNLEKEVDPVDLNEKDPNYDEALDLMFEAGKPSASLIQRKLNLPYSRAIAIVDSLVLDGIAVHKGAEGYVFLKNKDGSDFVDTEKKETKPEGKKSNDPKQALKDKRNSIWGVKTTDLTGEDGFVNDDNSDMPDFQTSSKKDDTKKTTSKKKSVSLPNKNPSEATEDLTKEDFNEDSDKLVKIEEEDKKVLSQIKNNSKQLDLFNSVEKENTKGKKEVKPTSEKVESIKMPASKFSCLKKRKK